MMHGKQRSWILRAVILAFVPILLPARLAAQACSYTPVVPSACKNIQLNKDCRTDFVDLANTQLNQVGDTGMPVDPAKATTLLDVCEPLQTNPSDPGFGEDYQRRLFARFAYRELFGTSDGPGATALEQEAITSLTDVQRKDFGLMGTDSSTSGVLGFLEKIVSDANRKGDGDSAMIGFVAFLLRYGNRIPQTVYDHVLNDLIDLSPGIGSVETLSYGASVEATAGACTAVAASCGPFGLFCGAGCVAAVNAERVQVPETENHITMIYAAQYLKHQILFDRTGDPSHDNARNGYRAAILTRLRGFVRNDFVEYNAHNYQDFEMLGLLSLASYADDPAVSTAAKNILDYISAKVAVSSDGARRSTPFRRHNDYKGGYFCDELLQKDCSDPQTAWYMLLADATDFVANNSKQDPNVLAYPPGDDRNGKPLPDNNVPETYSVALQWAQSSHYVVDPLIKDLFKNDPTHNTPAHPGLYQFFHYTGVQRLSGSSNVNDELYFRSPSYLISAGGHPNDYAYTSDIPFPLSLVTDALGVVGVNVVSKDDDLGVAVPTTLMPTGNLHSRAQMIRFYDSAGENLCVWRNFACGTNPVIPANYQNADPGSLSVPQPGSGSWSFFDQSGGSVGQVAGYYVAVYRQDNFGFFEVYDTWSNPQNLASLHEFAGRVFANNSGRTFSQSSVNTWTVVAGNVIQFDADAHIVTIDGHAPYDPNKTNGDVINNDGTGVVTITNPFTGGSMTLDASVSPGSSSITVPGPLNFPNTCVGASSYATLNVCNQSQTSEGLFVYNALSQNTQFQITEPSAGYPTSIGADFCFPFQGKFTPVAPGDISSKLVISNSDPTVSELRVAVTGTALQQGIATVISNNGDFGNVCVDSFTDLDLIINNTGGCDLEVTKIVSSSGEFVVAETVSVPLTIHAGGTLAVPIRFHPSSFGPKTANITVSSNDPNHPDAIVGVSGNAPAPVLNASIAHTGSFGNVCAGTQADLSLQVLNQGLCPLTISGIASTGGSSFTLPTVTTYPLVVSAGGSVNLPVRFQPAAYGSPNYITCSDTVAQTASVVIHSNDPNYPDAAPFVRSVSGIEGCPKLVLSPQNMIGGYAFPATVSDPGGTLGCYTDRQIAASNSGICPLTIASLTTANALDGIGAALPGAPLEFTVVNPTVPVTIAPGAAPVPITIRFKPVILTDQKTDAPDQQTGTLAIVSNDPVSADNAAGLCGEAAYHSGVRVLVVDGTNAPVDPVKSLTISSQGLTPTFKETLAPAPLLITPNVCGNTVQYQLDNETLRPAGTTGNNPKASYSISAKQGSTQANMSLTLGQCDVKQVILQLK
jgi:hypothetical protein